MNLKHLKEIPVEQASGDFIRQLDAMSKKQKYSFLFFFIIANVLFTISHKYGPPFYHIETISFDQSETVSNTRKFLLKIGKFNFLNDFITLDMIFFRNLDANDINKYFDVSLTVKSKKGKRSKTLFFEKSKLYKIHFSEQSNVSDKVRIYSRDIIDFVHLESDLVIKFQTSVTDEEDSSLYSGAFIFSYSDASHTIIESLVRLIFFICGICWLFYFNTIDISKTSTPLQLKIIYCDLILIVFASNPLYILSLFTESHFLPFLDSLLAISLVLSVSASTIIILDLSRIAPQKITKFALFIECIPFIILGLFFYLNEYLNHFSESSIPIMLTFFRLLGSGICLSLIMVSTLLYNTADNFEKIIMIILIFLTVSVTVNFEYVESIDSLISSNHAVQIFTFTSVATYVFFLAYLFKPVDPLDANDDIDDNNFEDDDENSYDVYGPF